MRPTPTWPSPDFGLGDNVHLKPEAGARALRLVVAVVAVLLGAVGCSSNDGSGSPSTQRPTADEAQTSVAAMVSTPVDEELLGDLVDAVVFPDDQGSGMVAVVDDHGSVMYASSGHLRPQTRSSNESGRTEVGAEPLTTAPPCQNQR